MNDKIKSLLSGEIVDFSYEEIQLIISDPNFFNINTLYIQKSTNNRYFCKVCPLTSRRYNDEK